MKATRVILDVVLVLLLVPALALGGLILFVQSEPGERWLYCYPDDAFAEY